MMWAAGTAQIIQDPRHGEVVAVVADERGPKGDLGADIERPIRLGGVLAEVERTSLQ
jgi:hypothetical protein